MKPEELKAELESVELALNSVSDKLKEQAAMTAEFKNLSAKQKETIDALLITKAETEARLTDLQTRLQDQEQRAARIPERPTRALLPGDHFANHLRENSDVASALAECKRGTKLNIEVPRSSFDLARVMNFTLTEEGTGSSLTYPADVRPLVGPLVRRLTIRDLLAPGQTSSSAIFFPRESGFTSNAEIQSEQGVLKGESEITFEDVTRAVVTIAHYLDVSTQMLSDVPFLQSYINGRLLYELGLAEELQLLLGSGTGQNLEGIYTAATAYVEPTGVSVTSETVIDRLRLMMLQVELADSMATGIVLHPVDWANIELTKDSDLRYIFTNPTNTTTGRLWGRDVVSTRSMGVSNGLVGDFARHAQIFDRQSANVAISYENEDNFVRNKATIRAEERMTLAIYRPEAFVKGSLDSLSSV